ncbi:unnamed protein product [Lymnaea stagnalis]|uniref:Proteasome assembly chaperone 3 n=1 Tax=Lymnaea stagnalis TaxID=6523 RepID=A0AAV2I8R8_LYMST
MAAAITLRSSIVPSKQTASEISGYHTEVVVNKFEDHLFIIATQFMKLGTIIQVTRDTVTDEYQENVSLFSTKVLLGKDEPITHVMAKTIVTSLNPPVPVILTLALKDTTPATVNAITDLIKSCL